MTRLGFWTGHAAMRALCLLARDARGAALAEFAMAFPLLLTLTLGGFELGRYVLLEQKLDSVAIETADLVAQTNSPSITTADLDNIFAAVGHIMAPFVIGANGRVIVTAVIKSNGGPITVNWQRAGGGTGSGTSRVGSPGSSATLPAGFVVRDGEAVIVSEVFYSYQPLFATAWIAIPAANLYNESFYRPRFGTLATLN